MKINIPAVAAGLAVVFLSVLVGSATSYFEVWPGKRFHSAYRAAEALYVQEFAYRELADSNLWQETSHSFSGVGRFDSTAVQPGLTLFTAGNLQGARLINLQGEVVHEWQLDFSEVWPDPQHLSQVPRPELTVWRKARALPNGDLIAMYIAEGITPWGLGLVRIDKDSRLIWKYAGKVHHDFDIGPDGRIYVLTHDIRWAPIEGAPRFVGPFLEDRVAILDENGVELDVISINEAFVDSPHDAFTYSIPNSPIGDYLHVNAIELVTEDVAAAHPYARPGEVLLSMRQPNALALLDTGTGKITWVKRGRWIGQHDPDFLDNGNILLFDNRGRSETGGISRLLEFDPLTGATEWQYSGDKDHLFESGLRSAQQRLANGNTLITESDRSRLLEVTPDGRVVWEYVNPDRGGPDNGYTPVLTWGQRYTAEQLPFLQSAVSRR